MEQVFTPLMDVIGKLPVWYEYNFSSSTTIENIRLFYAFLGSIVIGTCVDLEFFPAWFKGPCTVASDFGKYLCTRFYANPGHD